MIMTWLLILFALAAGGGFTLQAVVNHNLKLTLNDPVKAGFVSFFVATVILLLFSFINRRPWPSPATVSRAPWWIWIGGVFGIFMVLSGIIVAPRLGTAVYISLIVTGQLLASLFIDHYGFLGFQQHPINVWRVLGAVFLLCGVVLMRKF